MGQALLPRANASDERRHRREPTLKLGRVSLDRSSVLRCVVRDVSPGGGASLVTPKIDLIPAEFELSTDAGDPRRRGVACRLGWRLGIAFQF